MLDTEVFSVRTAGSQVTDLTGVVSRFCAARGDGLCHVFAPHATAGLALMETGAGSEEDLGDLLGRLMPRGARYRHAHGTEGHGADHLLPVLVSPSLVIAVEGGRPLLGTWQSVVLVDPNADNPERHVRCTWVPVPG